MFDSLPATTHDVMDWDWPQFSPYYDDLLTRPLTATTAAGWLADWTRVVDLLDERHSRLYVATTLDTTDQDAEDAFNAFLEQVYQPAQTADQALKQRLLDSGLQPDGFDIPLRNLRAERRERRHPGKRFLSGAQQAAARASTPAGPPAPPSRGRRGSRRTACRAPSTRETSTLEGFRLPCRSPAPCRAARPWAAWRSRASTSARRPARFGRLSGMYHASPERREKESPNRRCWE